MSSSRFLYVCISNNPGLAKHVDKVDIVEGTALSVLTKGRSMLHEGWELMANPLYGNFKPNQQPYRTLVLKKDALSEGRAVDEYSIQLIESAIAVYSGSHVLRSPGELPWHIDEDFRYLDFTLMEETFRQCGLLNSVMGRIAGR